MNMKRVLAVALAFALVLSLVPHGSGSASNTAAAPGGQQITVTSRGETDFTVAASATEETIGSIPDTLLNQIGNRVEREIPRGALSRLAVPSALQVPVVDGNPINNDPGKNFKGWNGISHLDQRLANNGNQFSLEPPDQGLCVGNGFVMEAVNTALAVYDTQGNVKKGVTALNTFYNYPAEINRTTGAIGPFTTDPKCLFDPLTSRWFLTILTLDTDPATGAYLGSSHVDLAVSKSSDPTKSWFLYSLDTTNGDGTLPGHPGCPCLGDQPLIGMDPTTFTITTNEFSTFGPEFNGAQVYVLPKLLLLFGRPAFAVYFDQLSLEEGPAYSLQPAFPNSKYAFDPREGGTEYLLSALDFNGTLDNRIALWALTGTATIYSHRPQLALNYTILQSETYGQPPAADQRGDGARLLGDALGEPVNQLETNDDRMNQVQYANGKLYSGVNTIVNVGGEERAGIAYFVVDPTTKKGLPVGKIRQQGYLAAEGQNLLFPAIAVSANDAPLMTFTLAGRDYYPSAAYASLTRKPVIKIAAPGAEPADGFTGYAAYGGAGVERWGDYSAAVTDGRTIWMATEYIPGGSRTSLANWGTFVFRVNP